MKVIFTGDPIELERGGGLSRVTTTLYGVTFPMSAEVDVSHLPLKLQQKLLGNSHFRAVGVDAPPAPLVLPESVRASADAVVASADDEEAAEAAAHVARAAKRKK